MLNETFSVIFKHRVEEDFLVSRCFFHATTFALHITCNEWVTSTFWHHIFCHCLNLFEALLLQSQFCRIKTYFVCTKPHITSLDIFLTLLALLILSPSYQITTQRRQWDLFSNFQLLCTLFKNYPKCRIWILAFSTNFCPIKTDLSGNTVWQLASGFQKLAKMDHFCHF